MMFTIIFPVLNERLRLESGVTRTVEYLHMRESMSAVSVRLSAEVWN